MQCRLDWWLFDMSAVLQTCPAALHLTVAVQSESGCRWKLWMGSRERTKEKGRGKRREEVGSPLAGSGVQSWRLSPAGIGMLFSSWAATLKPNHPDYVSIHLPLIGFNEWFNNTALPNQIKLLPSLIQDLSFVMQASSRTFLSAEQLQSRCWLFPHTFPLSFLNVFCPYNQEQAHKSCLKVLQQRSHKTGYVWETMSLTVCSWAQGVITPTGHRESDLHSLLHTSTYRNSPWLFKHFSYILYLIKISHLYDTKSKRSADVTCPDTGCF